MATSHPRKQLADLLKSLVPSTWVIIPEQRNFDTPTATTVIVKQSEVSRLSAAQLASRQIGFTLTLVSKQTTIARAEDDLDATLPKLLDILDGIRNLGWTTATKVAVDDKHIGYDIPITILAKKENL